MGSSADAPTEGRAVPDPGAAAHALAVGRIASAPGLPALRAGAVLDRLRRLVPYEAGAVVLLVPQPRLLVTVAERDGAGRLRTAATGRAALRDSDRIAACGPAAAVHVCHHGDDPGHLPGWRHHLGRSGLPHAVLVGLFTSGRRYLGFVVLLSAAPPPPPAVRALLRGLAPSMADAVDPLRAPAAAAELLAGCTAGVALCRSGRALPLPGLPGHSSLRTGSPVLVLAAVIAARTAHLDFLQPSTVGQRYAYTRVTVLSCGPCPPYDVVAVVLLSPAGELYGLTRRELQIAGLIVEGCTNQRIASTLHIAERTVAAHIEHVLPKLGAASRTQIAVRVLARGLYLPSPARLGPPGTDT
ncbi:helix-turn-helix transcriptional regulator [Streptomyces olivaceiscleroticus]|uniref:HTH luxR-type domain-containing protein n=1 Tax=Streptomyces olivaceiscleroticus TaxID=68245 RepID=A0ABN1AFP6_9ACTN